MNYWEIIKERRHKHLQDKYTIKPYHTVWRGLRIAMLPVSYIIQFITAVLAVALPAFGVYVISGSWTYGFIAGGVIMFIFEFIKRQIVNNTAISYFNKGTLSFVGVASVIVVIALSMACSGIGTPILVENFAPMPDKPLESEVITKYSTLKDSTKAYWSEVERTALASATEIHNKNNWKGVTVQGARSSVLGFKDQAKAAKDSLTKALSLLSTQQNAEWQEILSEYKQNTATRTNQKASVGFWLMWVTLFLELCFIACYAWLNYYDFREAAELGLVGVQSEAKLETVRPIVPQTSGKVKESEAKQAPHQRPSNIGFNNEGKIVNDGNKLSIVCLTAKGDLKKYDSSKLSTIIRQGGSRVEYWQDMKTKLDAAKKA